jgi:hypothetical protein
MLFGLYSDPIFPYLSFIGDRLILDDGPPIDKFS